MQQHHATHALRPPHMRATTNHMHQQAASGPPPQHIAINLGPPQQQNPALPPQTHHMNNIGVGGVAAGGGPIMQLQQQHRIQAQKSNYIPQQAQYNRLSHHHPQQQQRHHLMQSQHRGNQQTIHTTQMQKIRQQHQLVNSSNNNNNNSNNKSNGISNQHQQLLQQQQQQHQHMAVQPQQIQQHQRNIHHTTQHHVPNVKHKQQQNQQQHHSFPHIVQSTNVLKPQQQQQQQTQSQSQQQTQHGYASGNRAMPNNSNNNTNKNNHNSSVDNSSAPAIVPKSILQNPNRSSNNTAKQQHKSVVLVTPPATADTAFPMADEATTATIVPAKNKTEAATAATTTTPVVSAKLATTATVTEQTTLPAATSSVVSSENSNENAIPQDDNSNKENDDPTSNNVSSELLSDDVTSSGCLGASNAAGACKEKTPMCLVNELARLNKITHQYRLTNEKGPAHCKSFTVTLKLGDEEYSAEGYKIKKAQHLAAAKALENTKYKHPIPKLIRRSEEGGASRATITPTVELNALAMKLGQPTYYLFDPRQQPPIDAVLPPPPPGPGPEMMYGPRPHGPPLPHGGGPLMPPPPPHHLLDPNNPYMRRQAAQYHQRFNNYRGYMHPNKIVRYRLMPPPVLGHNGGGGGMPPHGHIGYPPLSAPCKITLIVGKQKFVGTGRTLQAAKHDAASRALQVIRTQAANQLNEILNRSMEESDSKSPISLVHEIGIKRNMPVHFKVLREEGPAHMKNFITACIAGTIVTEGCGNGKKISKKRAAEKMLEALKQLPPLSPSKSPIKRFKVKSSGRAGAASAGRFGAERSRKRVGGASIKDKSDTTTDSEFENENPISKLIILMQSRKEPEPVYELISKNGSETTRRREFIMEVSAAGRVARGRGNNMKLAKRNAAQNLLEILFSESASTSLNDGDAEDEDEEVSVIQQTDDSIGAQSSVSELVAGDNEESVNLSSVSTATSPAANSFELPTVTTSGGQVPGILILRQHKKHSPGKNALKYAAAPTHTTNATTTSTQKEAPSPTTKAAVAPVTTTTTMNTPTSPPTAAPAEPSNAKAADCSENSASADLNASKAGSSNPNSSSSSSGLRMKKQLLYLAQLLGFEVDFSDYPKGNHNEFLTIVTLSTTPEQICHGTGATSEESQNDAAKNALKILSDLNDVNNSSNPFRNLNPTRN